MLIIYWLLIYSPLIQSDSAMWQINGILIILIIYFMRNVSVETHVSLSERKICFAHAQDPRELKHDLNVQ